MFDQSNNTGAIDVEIDGLVLEEKSSFFSSELDWGSYIISIAKIASIKLGTLIRSMKFLSPEVALYLCICILLSCLGWCPKLVLGIVR